MTRMYRLLFGLALFLGLAAFGSNNTAVRKDGKDKVALRGSTKVRGASSSFSGQARLATANTYGVNVAPIGVVEVTSTNRDSVVAMKYYQRLALTIWRQSALAFTIIIRPSSVNGFGGPAAGDGPLSAGRGFNMNA